MLSIISETRQEKSHAGTSFDCIIFYYSLILQTFMCRHHSALEHNQKCQTNNDCIEITKENKQGKFTIIQDNPREKCKLTFKFAGNSSRMRFMKSGSFCIPSFYTWNFDIKKINCVTDLCQNFVLSDEFYAMRVGNFSSFF